MRPLCPPNNLSADRLAAGSGSDAELVSSFSQNHTSLYQSLAELSLRRRYKCVHTFVKKLSKFAPAARPRPRHLPDQTPPETVLHSIHHIRIWVRGELTVVLQCTTVVVDNNFDGNSTIIGKLRRATTVRSSRLRLVHTQAVNLHPLGCVDSEASASYPIF
jgi:hypothetical protein